MRAIIWCAVSTSGQADDDKVSLPDQEAQARQVCEREKWGIVEVLRVPGHSRRYVDIHECARDMLKQGIDAFTRLLALWETRAFDVLVVRDGSRFARTQALHAYVVERTISQGARIYSLSDGWIDDSNYRMWIAMGGYSASSEIDRLVKARRRTMNDYAARGLPVTSRPPLSHVVIRDETGKAIGMMVDESKRRLWDDVATVLLEGVAWGKMEVELYERFGHADDRGRPWYKSRIYRWLWTPTFWGHIIRYDPGQRYGAPPTGAYLIEPGHDIPEHINMWYDVTEAVYTGDQATQIKAEMMRRHTAIRGTASPWSTSPYRGLVICGTCGYMMSSEMHIPGYQYMRCNSHRIHVNNPSRRPDCTHRGVTRFKVIQAYVDRLLRLMVESESPHIDILHDGSAEQVANQIAQVEQDITDVERRYRQMIRDKADAPDDLAHLFHAETMTASEQLKRLRRRLRDLQSQQRPPDDGAKVALDDLVSMSLDAFWQQDNRTINQMLHRLMGNRVLVVIDGEVVGVADAPPKRRNPFSS